MYIGVSYERVSSKVLGTKRVLVVQGMYLYRIERVFLDIRDRHMLQSESVLSEKAWIHTESPAYVLFNLISMSLLFDLSENHAHFNSIQYAL